MLCATSGSLDIGDFEDVFLLFGAELEHCVLVFI